MFMKKNTYGFISIETMVVIASLILVAAITLVFLGYKEKELANKAGTQMTNADSNYSQALSEAGNGPTYTPIQ